MSLGRNFRFVAVGAAAVLILSACTDSSAAESSTTVGPSATVTGPTSGSDNAPSSTAATDGAGVLTSVPGLDPAAVEVMNKPPYAAGQWAIAVRDMESDEQIISLNSDLLFEPGSVVKTYSTGAAWQEFGPDSTIVTPVKRTGEVSGGTLTGDLILVGRGDLTMGGRTKPDGTVDFTNLDHNDANGIPGATLTLQDPLTGLDQLAADVKAAGIDSVTGDVIVDDRLWQPHELENGPVSPIVINQNVIDLTTTATTPGQLATAALRPQVAPWTVDVQVQTVAAGGDTEIEVASPDEKTILLTGSIAVDHDPVVNIYAFEDPATFARTAFIEALGRAGVAVTTDPLAANPAAALPATSAMDGLASVATLTSLPFHQEATYVLKISYNLGAETFICRLAVAAGSTKCSAGLAKAAEIWSAAGLDTTGAALKDGSGLPGNLITADNQVQLQSIMAERPDFSAWKATLPILGVDGSLALVESDGPAKGKVVGKTGTLGDGDLFNKRLRLPAKALGGYIDTKSGRQFAFAIISTNSVFADIEGVFAANNDVGKIVATIQQTY